MQMTAEQVTVNDVLNYLSENYEINDHLQIQVAAGYQIEANPIFQTALKDSMSQLTHQFHLSPGKGHEVLNPQRAYLIINEKPQPNSNDINIRAVFPFGVNVARILSGVFIKKPKDDKKAQAQTNEDLNNLDHQTVNDLVVKQLFKFYQPADKNVTTVPDKILESINYRGVKDDSFNLVTTFRIPIDDVYEPLKKVILEQDANKKEKKLAQIDYQKASLAPIRFISYDAETKLVQIITTLV